MSDYCDLKIHRDLNCDLSGQSNWRRRLNVLSPDNCEVKAHFVAKGDGIVRQDVMFDSEYMRMVGEKTYRCNESWEHVEGKAFVVKAASKIDPLCLPEFADVELLVRLPTQKYRIIDVAFCLPSGFVMAHEVQLAAITPEELEERTLDYERIGIDVVWWFGGKAETSDNKNWYREHFGEHPPVLRWRADVVEGGSRE